MAKDYSIGYKFKGDASGFQRTMGEMNKSINGFKNTMSQAAKTVVALFSVRAVANFVKESMVGYDKQIKAEASLLVALKGRTDIQKNLIRLSSELQRKTLFGDEETLAAASRMAMLIGANEEAIRRLLPLVQDLASAKFEGNLATAADLVSKSIATSTNALKRQGIEITGAVGSTERLESAIKSLDKAFGGQAEAMASVGLGPLKQLKNAWGDLTEQIGKAILESESFKKIISGLRGVVDSLTTKSVAVNDPFALWRGMDKETAKARRQDVLGQIDVYTKLGAAGEASLQFWHEALVVLDEIIGKTAEIIPPAVDTEIQDLVDKIYEGAEQSKKMAEAWKIVHAEIAASQGAAGLSPIGIENIKIGKYSTGIQSPGLSGSNIGTLSETNDAMSDQIAMVQKLQSTFESLFSNIGGGFKGMAESLIDSIEMIAKELIAKAAVFGILKLFFPEVFIGMGLTESGSFGKFLTGKFASGTNYAPGGLSLVGERGPELVNLPRGSQVIPNNPGMQIQVAGTTRIRGRDLEIAWRRI